MPAQIKPIGREGRAALLVLLLGAGALYLWDLDVSGWANPYYSAAAQAGSQSWKAFFFGSLDSGNAITVDKPPLGLWPIDVSVRIFGLSSWSVLAPQALEGVAAVAVLVAAVRRTTRSSRTALGAGALFALTPVVTLVFRYNNPDALLTLLLLGAGYATLRSLDSARALRWLLFAGSLVGLAFLTKMLEAFLVLPSLATTYAVFAAVRWRRRVLHLMAAFGAVLVGGGWWVAVVELWPAASRPWIGGSLTDSVLELAFGYNGLQRLTGSNAVSDAGGSALASTNVARISRTDLGGEIAWLLPAALLLGVVALVVLSRRPGRREVRAGLVFWFVWLVVPGLTFTVMTGIFHSYYTVILAPALAALVSIGGATVWRECAEAHARRVVGLASLATTTVAIGTLIIGGAWLAWLWIPVLVVGAVACILLLSPLTTRRVARATVGWSVVAAVVSPVAFSLVTAGSPHVGSGPMAGPNQVGSITSPTVPVVPASVADVLQRDSDDYTWTAAAVGARSASAYALASRTPVIAIGGYKGTDPAPTLPQFQRWVAQGRIHVFLPGGTAGPASIGIESWVEAGFTRGRADGFTYYDLTRPVGKAVPTILAQDTLDP